MLYLSTCRSYGACCLTEAIANKHLAPTELSVMFMNLRVEIFHSYHSSLVTRHSSLLYKVCAWLKGNAFDGDTG